MTKLRLTNSKRQILIYVILGVWIGFGLYAMNVGSSLTDLSIYFGSLAIPMVGYLFVESWKPSGKDNNITNDTKI